MPNPNANPGKSIRFSDATPARHALDRPPPCFADFARPCRHSIAAFATFRSRSATLRTVPAATKPSDRLAIEITENSRFIPAPIGSLRLAANFGYRR